MLPRSPKTRIEHRSNAPQHAPCPHGGTRGVRKQTLHRTVRGIAYQAILLIRVTTGEYRARCGCCHTFRTQVEGIEPKAYYTNTVREAVLDRLLEDHRSLERILAALARDFGLDLSTGFLDDCLRWQVRQLDLADYRRWTVAHFSGTLCSDEIHLGKLTLLLATDPLKDFPVAFALVSRNDQDHLRRFLQQLRDHGLHPRVVVSDGSNFYPAVLAAVWPQAEHQLCIFHVLQDLKACVLDAVCRLRKQRRRPRGKKRRRGRPSKAQVKEQRRRQAIQEKATFVFQHRYLIVKRREHRNITECEDLEKLLSLLPGLRLLRQFVERLHRLFEPAQTVAQAWHRFAALHGEAAFAADPDLVRALGQLPAAKFRKMVAFLGSPLGQRVRTNNHVERLNRQLRH